MSFCSSALAFSGYVAAIECNSVQVERPSCSTSGGQSSGILFAAGVTAATAVVPAREDVEEASVLDVVELGGVVVVEGELDLACFVNARHEATEVQSRHLEI